MNFEQFLLQEAKSYKIEALNIDKIKELLNQYCKKADLQYPIMRGMRGTADGYIIEGNKGSRTSITAGSFHNLFIDANIKKLSPEYPLRSNCVIGITGSDKTSIKYAESFGDVYALIPYDDTYIGVCDEYDILASSFKTKQFDIFYQINDIRKGWINAKFGYGAYHNLTQYKNMTNIVNDIYNLMSNKDFKHEGSFNNFNDILEGASKQKIKSIMLKLFDTKNIGVSFIKNYQIVDHIYKEAWVGGPCVAIKLDIYKQLIESKFKINEGN